MHDGVDVHLACALAGSAVDAFSVVYPEPDNAHLVQKAVDRAERAEDLTEEPVHEHTEEDDRDEDADFPGEKRSEHGTDRRLCEKSRNSAFQGPDRADVLAKCRDTGGAHRENKRQDEHEDDQNEVLYISHESRKLLFGERDFREQLLEKPEGTQKSADRPPEDDAESQEQSEYIEAYGGFSAAGDGLESSDRTGECCRRTGITVESGRTEFFPLSGIKLAILGF